MEKKKLIGEQKQKNSPLVSHSLEATKFKRKVYEQEADHFFTATGQG